MTVRERWRHARNRFWDVKRFYRARRRFGSATPGADMLASTRTFFRAPLTILFYPERPDENYCVYKLCAVLGHALTANPHRRFDVAFRRLDATFCAPVVLRRIPTRGGRIINAECLDISKTAVARHFALVFGYDIGVDPTRFDGWMVEKSDANARHDGRFVRGPLRPEDVRPGRAYQRAIDCRFENDRMIVEHRVPVYGGKMPLVYLKYRTVGTQFSPLNDFVELMEPEEVFTGHEIDRLLRLASAMGIDYGEMDVLRDKDGTLYAVDVNSTPMGPPNGLPPAECRTALERLSKPFDRLLRSSLPA